MGKYVLSLEAQRSLREVKSYSLKNFGKRQTTVYLKNIQSCMQNLANNPKIGVERPEIKQGYYSKFIGSHTIYYRINETHIGIIDILHQSMEPVLHIH